MIVNHLCFTAKDFLKLVGECEFDEVVYFQTKWGKFWKGVLLVGDYRVIKEIKKHKEITEIEELFPRVTEEVNQ